jgi:hypothetical protein
MAISATPRTLPGSISRLSNRHLGQINAAGGIDADNYCYRS